VSAIALIIWYGGGQAVREAITIGTLVVFLYYMRIFFRPIQDLAEKYNIIQSAFASLERIYLLLNDKSTIDDPVQPVKLSKINGNIEFINVCFNYNDNEPVLRNVSFTVKKGETVAIVGPTGAGKSTIINLLERLYDVDKGRILIDGVDIRDMEKSFLRSQIGLVMQDVFLFAGDVKSNITLGNSSFTEEEIQKALRIANAESVVSKIPGGLNGDVKEAGKTLSTGERQLLAFARAILINPNILILDEATSNIDPLTEGLIQDALEKLMEHRTSLVIAHRFSTIQKADRIIVMRKGRIHEQGKHEELLKNNGLYSKLYHLQYLT
jgi:ABC-type multidrug transport system fused ATPase/permease subunit